MKLAIFFAALIVGIYPAFAFSMMWLWFIVPLGVPAIGVAHAYGLLWMISVIKYRANRNQTSEEMVVILLTAIFGWTMALVAGFVVHHFYM